MIVCEPKMALVGTILLIQRTIDRQGAGSKLQPGDLAALIPLFYGQINPYGLFEREFVDRRFLEAA